MKASVIIPVYNAAPYLEQCLQSVLDQTCTDFEVICVDDESTDDSWQIIQRMAQADTRIKPMRQKNGGGGAARNTALDVARGDYLFFLDADDWYQPAMLQTMLQALEAQDAQICVCRSSAYNDENGDTWALEHGIAHVEYNRVYSATELWGKAFRYCVGWPWDKAFKRSYIQEKGLRFQELRTTNDAYFVYISLALAKRICFIEDDLVMHRVNNMNSLENTRTKSWNNALLAMNAVDEKLNQEGLAEVAERDLLNWFAHFGLWNFHTLDDETRGQFLEKFLELVGDRARGKDSDYFYEELDGQQMSLLYADRFTLLSEALSAIGRGYHVHEADQRTIEWLQNHIKEQDEFVDTLHERTLYAEREFIRTSEELDKRNAEFAAVTSSKSFKLGRALTAAPRALRDKGKHEENE